MRWIRVDVLVLLILVVLVLNIAPGHGVWGWVLAAAGAVLAGAVLGAFGRRYPWIYGRRRRRPRRL
jgi:O-antigen/teichoic acid export membrane protein